MRSDRFQGNLPRCRGSRFSNEISEEKELDKLILYSHRPFSVSASDFSLVRFSEESDTNFSNIISDVGFSRKQIKYPIWAGTISFRYGSYFQGNKLKTLFIMYIVIMLGSHRHNSYFD
jgi:hypothetical protein